MKVLLVEKFLQEGGKSGGTTRVVFEIAKVLQKNGHQVIPFTAWNDEVKEKSPDWVEKHKDYFVTYEDFSSFGFNLGTLRKAVKMIYNYEAARKIEELIKKEKPDLAYLHNIFHHIGPAILPVLKKYNIPVIHTLHHYKHISANYYLLKDGRPWEKDKGGKYWRYLTDRVIKGSVLAGFHEMIEMTIHHKLWRPFQRYVNLCTSPSKFLMQKSRDYNFPKAIAHLPYGLDENDYQPGYEPKNYMLFYGRLSSEKGVQTIIDALARIKGLNTPLYIVGQGEFESELRQQVQKQRLADKVKFLGFKTGAELHRLVREAKFVIVPSLWYENSPLTIYESLALGTPVVGAYQGGIPELIQEDTDLAKSTGVTFASGDAEDLADKIEFLLAHPELLPAMGQNARRYFEDNFTLDKYYERFLRLLDVLPVRVGEREPHYPQKLEPVENKSLT